jgi:DNA repair protein RecO (recombination protein O)
MLAHGRNLDVITQVQSIESLQPLREDLERLSRALYAAELVDRATEERAENFAVYRLLIDTLRRLAQRDDLDLVLRFFEMSLLMELGYQPELNECVVCRDPVAEDGASWSAGLGGVVCRVCRPPDVVLHGLTAEALRLLRLLQGGSFHDAARAELDPRLRDELERHLRETIHYALDRDVRSTGFLDAVRRRPRGVAPAARSSGQR